MPIDSDLSLLEIAAEDDSLLQQHTSLHSHTTASPFFICSPLQLPISTEEDTARSSFSRDKENKEEGLKLSLEPQQMKRKKKGGAFNLRKSLAWDRAFFTEQGVLDPVELSIISGNVSKFSGETLSSIREEDTSCAGAASSNLRAIEENLFTDLPPTTSGKYRKNGGSSFLPKNNSPVRKNGPPLAAKRKVLSAHDVNTSASKRSDCPRPVASSSLKRPANLITTKTSAKDSKVSRLPAPKTNPCASIKTSKSSTLGASNSKRNQTTFPVNIQKPSALKGSSSNTKSKSALNNSKVGPAGKSITTKTSLGQAKRNVASSVKGSTSLQYPLKTEANNDLDVTVRTSLLPADLGSNSRTGGSRTAISLPKNTYCTGYNTQPTQLPTVPKPSGLRMPSPSIGFFGQSKLPPMQSPLKMTSPPCNLPESNISNLRKFGASPNPVSELRPPLAPRSLLGTVRDGSLARNGKASCSSSGSPVLAAANPALYGVVETNSQATNRQMENIEQCNDTSYKCIKTLKELHGFVGVDELCPGKAGPPNTAIKFSIEDAELQMNDTNLLLKESSEMNKYEIDTKVVDSSQKSSELEIPQLKTCSSSAIEVTGPSIKSDISDHQLVEERPFDSSLKDHGVVLQVNPVCKADEPFGEQSETMHSLTGESGPFSNNNQMLQDSAADISSQVGDDDVAEAENSHNFPHSRSIELEKEDHDVCPKLNPPKGDIDEPYGKQTEMMNSLKCMASPVVSDSQMLQDNAADITSEVQGFNTAGIENYPANETFEEQTETMHSGPFFSDNQMLQDDAADISSHVEDYDVAETEKSHVFPHFRSIELEKEDHDVFPELKSQKGDIVEPYGKQTEMVNSLNYIALPIVSDSQMLQDNAADITSKVQGYNTTGIENSPAFSHIGFEEHEKELDKPFAEQAGPYPISSDSQMPWDNAADNSSKVQDYNTAELENSPPRRLTDYGTEDSTAIGELRKQSNVEDGVMQSGNRTDRNNNSSISISPNNDHKVVIENVIEIPEFVEFPKSLLTREDTLQVDGSLSGEESIFPEELEQENVLQSDETEVTDASQTELRTPRTSSMPDSMLDCESNADASVQCHILEDGPSVLVEDIIKPVVVNCNLNSHTQHEVGFRDQSTYVDLGNMDEGDLSGAVVDEDVIVTCQKVGPLADSELENPCVTCEPSFAVQVESEYSSKNKVQHVDVEVKNNFSAESSHCNFDSQLVDELCPCDENSSMVQMYRLEGENDDNDQGDQAKQITPYLFETKVICNDEKESTEVPTSSFDDSHSVDEPHTLENESNTRVTLHDGSFSLSSLKDADQTFKESEGGNHMIEEQDGNHELQNPVNQIEEVSSTSVPQDEGVTEEHKESGINKKQDVLVIKPPPNATPFSDEWLAAFEAAGEEILTMKSGAVQNSPEEKPQREPGPWSPVKRKQNQEIGPYDCTKYTNTNS
ncbi:hypothetical protein CsatB_030615 [Cannabis sativa]